MFADFKTNEYDVDGSTSYVGMAKPDGDVWLVQRVVDTAGDLEIRWANISNNASRTTFTLAWTNRATLTYNLIDDVVVV